MWHIIKRKRLSNTQQGLCLYEVLESFSICCYDLTFLLSLHFSKGVPLGSILDPVLVTIYLNSINKNKYICLLTTTVYLKFLLLKEGILFTVIRPKWFLGFLVSPYTWISLKKRYLDLNEKTLFVHSVAVILDNYNGLWQQYRNWKNLWSVCYYRLSLKKMVKRI